MLSISNHHNVGNQLYSNIKVFLFLFLFFLKVKLGWSAGELSTFSTRCFRITVTKSIIMSTVLHHLLCSLTPSLQ